MTRVDFAPLFRSTVGFDRMTPFLETALKAETASETFPPYNIVKSGEDTYCITLAVAGFAEDDLEIEVNRGTLTVQGSRSRETDAVNYLHRGINWGGFKRQFQLADYVEVAGASLENGLLTIDLERRIPEEMKPREIKISNRPAKNAKVIDGKKSAA